VRCSDREYGGIRLFRNDGSYQPTRLSRNDGSYQPTRHHIPEDLNLRLVKSLYSVIKEERRLQEIALRDDEIIRDLPVSIGY
jgi:hypothetical protein